METGTEVPTPAKRPFRARLKAKRIAEVPWIYRQLGSSGDVQIVDVREKPNEYCDGAGTPNPAYGWHIPGAINMPYDELYDGDRIKSAEELKNVFDTRGIKRLVDHVVYCHSARRSAYAYFALRLMRYRVRNHDSAMKFWTDIIVEKLDLIVTRYWVYPCEFECLPD